ncbi:hypothetical protein H6786_00450 [Candidatus Nomurabacteria bacterium]|nr:hypothetical protein [Candidatus Nomurabacteria bacterium]
MTELLKIVHKCVDKIKDDFLLFSVATLVLMVAFPEAKMTTFIVYGTAVLIYVVVTLIKSRKQETNNRFLQNVDDFLNDPASWERRTIDHSDVYFYSRDNNYKIVTGDESIREWEPNIEPWMQNFPDPHVSEYNVYLKHGENTIAEYKFVYCDGARYFMPLPKKRCAEPGDDFRCNRFEYIWNRNSIEYKIGTVIGDFYRYENLEEVARFCGIVIE